MGWGKKLLSPHPSGPTAAPGCLFTSSASPQPVLPLPGDPRRILTRFSQENVSHYDIFLLGEGEEELYVGARDTVLALAVGAPGTIHAKASVSDGVEGCPPSPAVPQFPCSGRATMALPAWQLQTLSIPSPDNVGPHG